MKAIHTLTIIAAAAFAATSASAQVTGNGSVNVQSTSQGSTVVVQGGAAIPLSKAVTVTPQVQLVIPPPVTQAPPVFSGGVGVTVHF